MPAALPADPPIVVNGWTLYAVNRPMPRDQTRATYSWHTTPPTNPDAFPAQVPPGQEVVERKGKAPVLRLTKTTPPAQPEPVEPGITYAQEVERLENGPSAEELAQLRAIRDKQERYARAAAEFERARRGEQEARDLVKRARKELEDAAYTLRGTA